MDNKINFQKLTPVKDAKLDVYNNAFDFIFKNDDLRNIAITGSYGSGKSSILESYKAIYKNINFIHISLAHFQNNKGENINVNTLEGKIINQLIHKISPEKIRQSNFKVKNPLDTRNILIYTLVIMLSIISILNICFFAKWNNFVELVDFKKESYIVLQILNKILGLSSSVYAPILSGIFLLSIMGIFVFRAIESQKYKNILKKIMLHGNGVEMFEKSNDSYFDKYLSEIIYLFRNSEADVIVFEDIDRYEENKIFEKLYEINHLINVKLNNKKNQFKTIKFFYLIRDDVFKSKDRTKFFDYIMPIVPVVDSSNTSDQMIKLFTDDKMISDLNKIFIKKLSLYIDDMRLLKNIYNEFSIYYNILKEITINPNKMLAIITYKNLFPKDFINLHLNMGYVYSIFSKKKDLQDFEKDRLGEQIALLNKNYEDTKNELSELQLIKNTDIHNKKVNELKKKIEVLKHQPLKDIITNENEDRAFNISIKNASGKVNDFLEIKDDEYYNLLKFLIREGYIDDSWSDYMTYFYGERISRIDKNFSKSVIDRKSLEYEYKLDNPEMIFDLLTILNFDQEEILNFDLFDYMLEDFKNGSHKYNKYLDKAIIQLKNKNNFNFIKEYYCVCKYLPQFIYMLNYHWAGLFGTLVKDKILNEYQMKFYSIYSLIECNKSQLVNINIDNCFVEYIENCSDYLKTDKIDTKILIEKLIIYNIHFISIDSIGINKKFLKAVYENSLYQINLDNINLMLREFYKVDNEDELKQQNMTCISSKKDSPLHKYVYDNIEKYVEVIINAGFALKEDEDVVISILENEEIKRDIKVEYIRLLNIYITDITEISDMELWKEILTNNLMMYNEENIINYYMLNMEELSEELVDFINDKSINRPLCFGGYYDKHRNDNNMDTIDIYRSFVSLCSMSEKIDLHRYKEIVDTMGCVYNNFDLEGIGYEKMSILIKSNSIKMNVDNLNFIRNNYMDSLFDFIRQNIDKYVKEVAGNTFNYDELIEILSWDILDELKIQLIGYTDDKIGINKKLYSPEIINHILMYNFDIEELTYIFSSYITFEQETKDIIYQKATEQIEYITNNFRVINRELIDRLIDDNKLDLGRKALLVKHMIPRDNRDNAKKLLDRAGFDEQLIKVLDAKSKPKVRIKMENEIILEALRQIGYVSKFDKDSDKPQFYKIRRNGLSIKGIDQKLL